MKFIIITRSHQDKGVQLRDRMYRNVITRACSGQLPAAFFCASLRSLSHKSNQRLPAADAGVKCTKMNSQKLSEIIEIELSSYSYEKPQPETTYGEPWSEDKVLSYIPKLRRCLVTPHLERFRLGETIEQFDAVVYENYWVVAIDEGYIQWYDPKNQDYGLGTVSKDGEFMSMGVRGDLLGVYCAM